VQPSRRQVLLAAGVATAAACTTDRPLRPLPPTPDEALRLHAVTREQALVDAYRAALLERPDLTIRLAPLLGDHTAHLAALLPDVAPSATDSPSPTLPPRSAKQVLTALAVLEREAATAHATAAERAEKGTSCTRALAPLLASLAACEASHAAVL